MLNIKPQEVSEEEQKVVELEARYQNAESGLQVTSEAKKKLEKDIEILNEKISSDIKLLSDLKEEYVNVQKLLIKNKKLLDDEKFELDKFSESTEKKRSKIETEFNDLAIRKNKMISENQDFKEECRKSTERSLKDLSLAHEKVLEVVKEIVQLEADKIRATDKLYQEGRRVDKIRAEIVTLNKTKTSLEETIERHRSIVDDQNNLIKENNVLLDKQEIEKENKATEISSLESDISKKKEEYKTLETKAFSILNKQQLLESREAFIKNQYERAGIQWEEIK